MSNEDASDYELLFKALKHAQDEFEEYLEEKGRDPAYFDTEIVGYTLNSELEPWKKIILPARDTKVVVTQDE